MIEGAVLPIQGAVLPVHNYGEWIAGENTMKLVTSYRIRIDGDSASVELESDTSSNLIGGSRIAWIEFGPGFEPEAFINRGGFLTMRRPIDLLAPFLAVLQNESPVNLDDDGRLSTGAEPVGESEDQEQLEPA